MRIDEIPLEAPPSPAQRTPPRGTLADRVQPNTQSDMQPGTAPGGEPGFSLDSGGNAAMDFGSVPAESSGSGQESGTGGDEDPFAKISELMMARPPEPIPDVFATPVPRPAPRRKGAAGLWLLLVLLLAFGAAAVFYFLQDRIIDHWPDSARIYDGLGIRNEVVGAGLAFRNYNSERLVQDDKEVLVVRGVIANTTEQAHEIPLLRLALYNNQALLQEKIISPPQTTLDAHATVGFRITLDQPDANATRFEVTFTAPKPPEAAK